MLKLFCFAVLFSFPAAAQERLNWQPLEVTVAEEENEEEKDNASSSLQKTEGRFKSLMADLKESVENKAAKKNRKVEAINQETLRSECNRTKSSY